MVLSVAALLACRYLDAPILPIDAGATPAESAATIGRFGARAVLVGRPVLVGLAADGARGVAVVLRRLLDEFQAAQASQ